MAISRGVVVWKGGKEVWGVSCITLVGFPTARLLFEERD